MLSHSQESVVSWGLDKHLQGECPELVFGWTWVAGQGHPGHFMVISNAQVTV